MKIVYVYADKPGEWNSSEWRCAIPARSINQTGRHKAELINIQDFSANTTVARKACNDADVLVIQRKLYGPVLAAIQHWKARDKAIVVDFDNAYQLIPETHPDYAFWALGFEDRPGGEQVKLDPTPLKEFQWGLRLAHAVTVPSKRLADDWQAYANVQYLPNYIELRNYEFACAESHNGTIIGWGGSASHTDSFRGSGVFEALRNVCHVRPDVKIMICGARSVYDQLPVPEEQKIFQPWVPYTRWPQMLSSFDIGLAPLFGEYDQRRSWIKALEYMVMKIPWVASESPAYNDLRGYGWMVKNTPGAWERVLLDMVDNREAYKKEAAGEAYVFSIGQNIDENIDAVLATYASIQERALV